MDSIIVEVPLVSVVSLDQTAEEAASPVRAGDFILEKVDNGRI